MIKNANQPIEIVWFKTRPKFGVFKIQIKIKRPILNEKNLIKIFISPTPLNQNDRRNSFKLIKKYLKIYDNTKLFGKTVFNHL